MPDLHACYDCLLESNQPLLKRLSEVAGMRSAITLIQETGFTSGKALAEKLGTVFTRHPGPRLSVQYADLFVSSGVKNPLALSIASKLKGQDILVLNPDAAKRKHSKKFRIVESGPGYITMMKEYFDPTLHIGHLVCVH